MRIETIRLASNQTYTVAPLKKDNHWAYHISDRKNKTSLSLIQSPLFSVNQPKYFKTIKDLLGSAIDVPVRRVKKMQLVVEDGSFYPYSINNPGLMGVPQDEFQNELKYVYNTSLQLANDKATAIDLDNKFTSAGFFLLTSLCVFLVLIMGIIALTTVYGG